MKCRRENCPNAARPSRLNRLCDRHNRALGATGYVDGDPVREHLQLLHRSGWGWQEIANAAGMTRTGTDLVRTGVSRRVQAATAERVLSIPLAGKPVANGALVSSLGSWRRATALMAVGHCRKTVAREAGISNSVMYRIFHGDLVTAETAAKLSATFQRLEHVSGASRRSINEAAKFGWPPPLSWDEDSLDDPCAMPDAKINVYASTRRLRSLCRMGFAQKYLSERLDIPTDKTSEILRFLGPIDYSLADAIEKLFDELRATPSDDERLTSRRAAQARTVTSRYGWVFPDELGDIFKKPSKEELASMDKSNDERVQTVKKMLSEGVSKAEIARRMNVNPATVYLWLREAA